MQTSTRNHPPRPRLVFRVGITGHRPNRLVKADLNLLRRRVREVLESAGAELVEFWKQRQGWFSPGSPVLRLVTPLAEGADRLLFEAALEIQSTSPKEFQFEFCCPMPFAKEEFEKDFPNSVNQFRELLERATSMKPTIFEMDGNRASEPAAYAACSRVVQRQSDLLIAIWDGVTENKIGGTEATMAMALGEKVPVLWIDAKAPHAMQMLKDASEIPAGSPAMPALAEGGTLAHVREAVTGALELPEVGDEHSKSAKNANRSGLERFYDEKKPGWSLWIFWQLLQDIVGGCRWPRLKVRIADFEDDVESEWPRIAGKEQVSPIDRTIDWLRPFYAWPDKLSVYCANAYRSAFLLCYAIAAAAVGMALVPMATGWDKNLPWAEKALIAIEGLFIIGILVIVMNGRKRHWHKRWISYRLTAELVRHAQLVVPLGGGPPFPQPQAHQANYGTAGSTWMAWYVRCVQRDLGLPCARVDEQYVNQWRDKILGLLDGQIGFYQRTSHRSHRIENILFWTGISLLLATLLMCVVHLAHEFGGQGPHWLTLAAALLPAVGAALAGISNQGEFLRMAKRSASMVDPIKSIHKKLADLKPPSGRQYSTVVGEYAAVAAGMLLTEVMDWRIVFIDRPLLPPA